MPVEICVSKNPPQRYLKTSTELLVMIWESEDIVTLLKVPNLIPSLIEVIHGARLCLIVVFRIV